jgi:hypothetical protein
MRYYRCREEEWEGNFKMSGKEWRSQRKCLGSRIRADRLYLSSNFAWAAECTSNG